MHTRGRQFPKEVILTAIRWYLTYPLSYRQVEELPAERGVSVDHTTIHRWTIRYAPALHGQFMRRHRRVGDSWRMDETYVGSVRSQAFRRARSLSGEGGWRSGGLQESCQDAETPRVHDPASRQRDLLVAGGGWAQKVPQLVMGKTEPCRRAEALEA